jgi:hypothetical protein
MNYLFSFKDKIAPKAHHDQTLLNRASEDSVGKLGVRYGKSILTLMCV